MTELLPLAKPDLSGNELKYLTECIKTGYVTHAGRFEGDFEKSFGERFKTSCIATSSGTGALHLALLALGVGPGDEVVVPSLTFGATASVVLAVGAKPVFVDVDESTWGLDQKRILGVLNKRTRAIIPVHLYGTDAGDYRQFGIPVIEDACESLGMVPLRGDFTAFSFYGNKVITTGEGGMLCGKDLRDAKDYRDGGFDSEYRNRLPGLNYRLSNLSAAVGLAQLERFDELLGKRLANAERYSASLKGKGRWMFCAESDDPRGLQAFLKERGIDSRPVFTPLHRSPAFRQYAKGNYKNADSIWGRHLVLPTGPHVSEEDITRITECVNEHQHLQRASNSSRKPSRPLGLNQPTA
jgi:perosamine synthetase